MYKLFERNIHIKKFQLYQTRKTCKLWKKIPIHIIILFHVQKKTLTKKKLERKPIVLKNKTTNVQA
jgi:hypothetical protein